MNSQQIVQKSRGASWPHVLHSMPIFFSFLHEAFCNPTQQSTKWTQSSLSSSSFSPPHITSVLLLLFHGREQSSKSRLVCNAQTCWQLHTYSFITLHSLQCSGQDSVFAYEISLCVCDISGTVSVDVLN